MSAPTAYEEFVAAKAVAAEPMGFDPGDAVSGVLFPFQRDLAAPALFDLEGVA